MFKASNNGTSTSAFTGNSIPMNRGGLVDDESFKLFGNVFSTYINALHGSTASARKRAEKPLIHHPWVFASSMATATVASQAPYTIYKETDAQKARGNRKERRGSRRTAIRRYSKVSTHKRLMTRALETDYDHELNTVLEDPNPHQDGRQMWQMTFMLMAVEGECFWVFTNDAGVPIGPNETPTQIWPMASSFLTPIQEGSGRGALTGWEARMPSWMPLGLADQVIPLTLDQVIQFKLPNPTSPLRGISRLTPVALAIENDLSIASLNRATLDNSGVPRGGLTYPGNLDPEQKEKLMESWKQKHSGPENAGKMALLTGGMMWQAFALSPQEGQYLEQKKSNRDEELAVMATPDSVLGIADAQTYATQLGQDKNFWDKNLIPLMRLIEAALDRSALFFTEADNIVGLFDLSQVEALRAGLMDKITAAQALCAVNLHMPPTTAYSVVGLEVDEYIGDDICLVPLSVIKLEDAIADPEPVPEALDPLAGGEESDEPEEDEEEGDDGDSEDLEADEGAAPDEEPDPEEGVAPGEGKQALFTSKRTKSRIARVHRGFLLLEVQHEKRMRPRYRNWVRNEKAITLAKFNGLIEPKALAAARKAGVLDLHAILPDLKDSRAKLTSQVRPLYPSTTADVFEFTLGEIGVPTFGIDDPQIVKYWDKRLKVFTKNTPKTVFDNLRRTLTEGIRAGEDFAALRARVASVYDISANSAKVQQIVRTETSGLMNGVRREMFNAQGFTKTEWSNAGDENVREDHVIFQGAGPQDTDFNYLELVGGNGTLEFPGDTRAPAGQVINCRCIEVPTE